MIELILALLLVQQSEPITCTVITPDKLVECPARSTLTKPQMLRQRIDHWSDDLLDQWRFDVEYVNQPGGGRGVSYNEPLKRIPTVRGQKVKAVWQDGQLVPIPRCDVRRWLQVDDYVKQGQPPPPRAYSPPDDCEGGMRF